MFSQQDSEAQFINHDVEDDDEEEEEEEEDDDDEHDNNSSKLDQLMPEGLAYN